MRFIAAIVVALVLIGLVATNGTTGTLHLLITAAERGYHALRHFVSTHYHAPKVTTPGTHGSVAGTSTGG